ncbi:uncharacterized protein BDR25DRAFT_351943 [Lindgomyces ingoldianus]|uniref:Uncharacterized protein n=1 Tax=Lindgomyces ingoldianus TaxID=673940 RepID=A0ACB6R549_9PLEO|nr:uncharacterized protein BDR25DRAFT_351943 [Lindgomyces ingoldianus]KAF2474403.1 hypothetical protein BDR25DRAFT_351943 [Lindgomyces ingoldianus]
MHGGLCVLNTLSSLRNSVMPGGNRGLSQLAQPIGERRGEAPTEAEPLIPLLWRSRYLSSQ